MGLLAFFDLANQFNSILTSFCGEEAIAFFSADCGGIQLVGERIGPSIARKKYGERSSHQRTQVRVERLLVDVVADAHRTSIYKVGCAQRLEIAVAVNL